MYGFLSNNAVGEVDPLGLYSFSIDDKNCAINLDFKLQLFFESGLTDSSGKKIYGRKWDDASKIQYAEDIKRVIEQSWNSSSLRIYPKGPNCCSCGDKGLRPVVKVQTQIEGFMWDDVEASVVRNYESEDFRSFVQGSYAALSVNDVNERTFQGMKRFTAAHEFGHMIGLQHPSHGLPGVEPGSHGEYMERNAESHQRRWGKMSNSIMGGGMELRKEHFQQWVDALNKLFPNCAPFEIR